MDKISTCLWFDTEAEAAMKYYTSIFKKSKKGMVTRYGKHIPGREGQVMTAHFEIEGRPFMALNGGPEFKFNESISLIVNCKDQKEIDYYWKKLTANGGQEVQCGWLRDKYGVAWQIVPKGMNKFIAGKDKKKTERYMDAMMKMVKLDIKTLEKAYAGK